LPNGIGKEDTWRMTVAAIAAVLGGKKTLRRTVSTNAELQLITREGLPAETLPMLAEELSVERSRLAKVVGISERTLSRRLVGRERLSAGESDRMVRLARILAMAGDVLGSSKKASLWLKSENRALHDERPLDLLDTDTGARAVETVLGRIAYGLYS
jgi:putative toxin-antitoxin system antitoxin component (TIGR02293 family)